MLENANNLRLSTPLSVSFAPPAANRSPTPAPVGTWMASPKLCTPLTVLGRTDYAASGGEDWVTFGPGPADLLSGSNGSYFTTAFVASTAGICTGVVIVHHRYKFTDIEDGLSNTFMLGEKAVNPDMYTSGLSYGDDQGPFISDERDSYRAASLRRIIGCLRSKIDPATTIPSASAAPTPTGSISCFATVPCISSVIASARWCIAIWPTERTGSRSIQTSSSSAKQPQYRVNVGRISESVPKNWTDSEIRPT